MKNITTVIISLVCLFSIANAQTKDKYASSKKNITDLGRILNPGGVQESYPVDISGVQQWVFVRGQDRSNPVVLFIHGGPVSPMAPLAWTFQRPMEEYFTMVQYDQRASGKTFRTNDTVDLGNTIHIDPYVDDAVKLRKPLMRGMYLRRAACCRTSCMSP